MGHAFRLLIVDQDDTVYRISFQKFDAMHNEPRRNLMPRFAGQRVRIAGAIVDFRDRIPCGIVRVSYFIRKFDNRGALNWLASEPQSNIDDLLKRAGVGAAANETGVVDARSRFIVRGYRWQPSTSLARRIGRAALGELKCDRI